MAAHAKSERFRLIQASHEQTSQELADAARTGLSGENKSLPYRFLYDAIGSQIFEEICSLPEYYLTRADREILQAHANEIVAQMPADSALIELGSGSSEKTRALIEAFLALQPDLHYLPIDISRAALEASARPLLDEYAALSMTALACEYEDGLRRTGDASGAAKLVIWLGSSVGNLHRAEASEFLARLRPYLRSQDRLLIGIDLRKDSKTLELAYDDPRGVTARFILNMLARLNRELETDFDLQAFRHVARYEVDAGRIVIALRSLVAQRVFSRVLGIAFEFQADEEILIEYSYKYSQEEIEALAASAGLRLQKQWRDEQDRFSENLFVPT